LGYDFIIRRTLRMSEIRRVPAFMKIQTKFFLLFMVVLSALILACGSENPAPVEVVATSPSEATVAAAVDATVSALPESTPTVEVIPTTVVEPTAAPVVTPIIVSTVTVTATAPPPEPTAQILPCPIAVSPANVSYTPRKYNLIPAISLKRCSPPQGE